MKVLITGAAGQVGRALLSRTPAAFTAQGFTHAMLDVGDELAVSRVIAEQSPDLVVNAAAYTAVDRAENEADLAFRINAQGAGHLARAAKAAHARLIHISTDFVFDGAASQPYSPDSPANPLCVYGASKHQGEIEVLEELDSSVVLRTAWVYAAEGKNFMRTMLRLMATRGTVRVVNDQEGTPTAAISVADAIWRIAAADGLRGIHHWTDDGTATWYEFACEIARLGEERGLLPPGITVTPISTAEYPTPAQRPRYSVLDRHSLAALHIHAHDWRDRLREVMLEVASA